MLVANDRDGHIDAFVANDSTVEFLYHNRGNGTFEETGLQTQVAVDEDGKTYAGMGTDFADYDNDGYPDLVVDDLANQKYALYHNNQDGSFSYVSQAMGLARFSLLHSGWGLRFFDYDNDGRKDLAIAQGRDLDNIQTTFPQRRYREPMMLIHNIVRKFEDVSAKAGAPFNQPWIGRGLATGDIDNDGRVDLVVTTNGGPLHVLRNETQSANHWLIIDLVGHKSNRDAIGAELKLSSPQGPQYATVTTAGSYLSSSDKRVHFGLGSSPTASSVEIVWPSGKRQKLTDIKADQILKVDEPE